MSGTACGRTHLGPVSEGDDQWEDEGLLIGQSSQVGGGLAGMVVPCTHFAHQPTASDTTTCMFSSRNISGGRHSFPVIQIPVTTALTSILKSL